MNDNIKKLLTKEKLPVLAFWAGLLGILLIFASSFTTPTSQKSTKTPTHEEYTTKMEQRITDLVSCIDGVGKVKVMITLESGVEYVFAQQERKNTDTTQDYDGDFAKRLQKRDNTEESYILIEGEDGRKQALVQKELEPKIKGVVVVCEGADSSTITYKVTEVITTALDIPSTKVCVAKIT